MKTSKELNTTHIQNEDRIPKEAQDTSHWWKQILDTSQKMQRPIAPRGFRDRKVTSIGHVMHLYATELRQTTNINCIANNISPHYCSMYKKANTAALGIMTVVPADAGLTLNNKGYT
jgi:hypothetical protein